MADEDPKFHLARGIGIDAIKLLLNVVISLNIIPLIFHENIGKLFGKYVGLLYCSWIAILLAVLLGFLAYFFIFEGYYHQALNKEKQGDRFLDAAHYFGIGCLISFIVAIFFIIFAVGYLILSE